MIEWLSKVQSVLQHLIQVQRNKYKQLGYGKYVAFLTFTFYFTIYPQILASLWPYLYNLLPCLHNNYTELPLYVLTIISLNVLITIIYSLAMYFIYTLKIPFFQSYRVDPNTPWPWQQDAQKWRSKLWKTIGVICLNVFIISPALTTFDSFIELDINMKMQNLPSMWTNIWQFFLFLLGNQVVFYMVHSVLHHPKLYWIHKQHHEYNVTVTIASQYAHPIQQLLANTIPVGLTYKLLAKFYPVHIFTIIIWLTFRLFQTSDGHSGYEWSWGQSNLIPLSAGGKYHYFHHKQNVGNYGAILCLMDRLMGTDNQYRRYSDKQDKKKD